MKGKEILKIQWIAQIKCIWNPMNVGTRGSQMKSKLHYSRRCLKLYTVQAATIHSVSCHWALPKFAKIALGSPFTKILKRCIILATMNFIEKSDTLTPLSLAF